MLILEQKPYVLYINLNYTNLSYEIYTTTLKNYMQKTLDAIIGKNQSQDNITHLFHDPRCNWCPI